MIGSQQMKSAAIIVALLLLAVTIAFFLRRSMARRRSATIISSGTNVYSDLRDQIFRSSRASIGLASTSKPRQPWGAVMDWGLGSGTITVVAISDGTASVYLSSAGGYIGGGQSHESIRHAAQDMVAIADKFQPQMRPTTSYPLPQSREIILYVLTDAGLFSARGTQDDFSSHRHPLSNLGDAAQKIITLYHELNEGK
jgi:hypothetical protein